MEGVVQHNLIYVIIFSISTEALMVHQKRSREIPSAFLLMGKLKSVADGV